MVDAAGHDAMAETFLAGLGATGIDVSRMATVEGPMGCAYIEVATGGENRIASGASAHARSGAQLSLPSRQRTDRVLSRL